MTKHAKLLWLDLEMTGLDPANDLILEVAMIASDWDFKELATYEGIIKNHDAPLGERLMVNSAFWDANPAARDGLVAQNQHGKTMHQIENEIVKFIDGHFAEGERVLLAGNSIHMDRQFINVQWPRFAEKLHYRMLDVSAWKVVFEGKYGKKFAKPEEHRALGDIRGSIMELKYYLTKIQPARKMQ